MLTLKVTEKVFNLRKIAAETLVLDLQEKKLAGEIEKAAEKEKSAGIAIIIKANSPFEPYLSDAARCSSCRKVRKSAIRRQLTKKGGRKSVYFYAHNNPKG